MSAATLRLSSLHLPCSAAATTATATSARKPTRNSLIVETAQSENVAGAPVSRRLILLRHAQSSWEDRSLRDHDRPLSKSGRDDAVRLSKKLEQLGWIPELILSSDAQRTRETLRIMQEEVHGFLEAEAICKHSRDDILTIMCMGHNRGWEEAASMFSGASIELETCNAALLEAMGKSWEEAFSLAGFGGWKLHGVVKPDMTT